MITHFGMSSGWEAYHESEPKGELSEISLNDTIYDFSWCK